MITQIGTVCPKTASTVTTTKKIKDRVPPTPDADTCLVTPNLAIELAFVFSDDLRWWEHLFERSLTNTQTSVSDLKGIVHHAIRISSSWCVAYRHVSLSRPQYQWYSIPWYHVNVINTFVIDIIAYWKEMIMMFTKFGGKTLISIWDSQIIKYKITQNSVSLKTNCQIKLN